MVTAVRPKNSPDASIGRLFAVFDHPPCDRPMVVEGNLHYQLLERVSKLVLICEKVRRTMNGPAKVTIESSRDEYVSLES
jgi:hypothetical protein